MKYYTFTIKAIQGGHGPTFLPDIMSYMVYQLEKGEHTGFEHYQGYVEFKGHQTLKKIKRIFNDPTIHIERRKGTAKEASDYCKKSDSRLDGPFEFGTISSPKQGERRDLFELTSSIKAGKRGLELIDAHLNTYAKYSRFAQHYEGLVLKSQVSDRQINVSAYIGPTGCGKTYAALSGDRTRIFKLTENPNKTVWFHNYCGETTLVLDDFTGWLPFKFLLNVLDPYPLAIEIKGGSTYAQWTTVIITSTDEPNSWYPSLDNRYYSELHRRLGSIKRFTKPFRPESVDDTDGQDGTIEEDDSQPTQRIEHID